VRAAGETLAPLARRCGDDLERFLTEISLGAVADALDPRADAITLLTIHAAKGLEFDVVFLAGCEKDLLPLRLPGARAGTWQQEAEERRLLFVAMTRARARLFLTWFLDKEQQSKLDTWSPRKDVPPPAGLPPLFSLKLANKYPAFISNTELVAYLRKRFETLTGPVKNKGDVK